LAYFKAVSSPRQDENIITVYGKRVKSNSVRVIKVERQKEVLGQYNSLKLNRKMGKNSGVG
jgi:hypothetical protein